MLKTMAFVQSLSKTVSVIVFGFVLLNCFVVDKFGSHAQVVTPLLPQDEVQILETISNKLNIKNWSIDRTSCGGAQWNQTIDSDKIQSNVTCDCRFDNGTVCHVTNFGISKSYSTARNALAEFCCSTNVVVEDYQSFYSKNLNFRMTEMKHLSLYSDLTRNYINGSIPASLAQLPNLQSLSLLANRLTGSIPREIGSIATLESLVLEDNLLGGSLHPDLGNLRSLKRLLLSANNFTGRIPDTFGNLKNLTDFRIDGSELSGKIPDFIGNWTNIERLDLQGTSMEGPIPPTISLLKNLTNLRISDLKGSSPTFPNLQAMTNMKTLILRNCSMTASIPEYIGNMAELDTLDLSFNKLTGQIPDPLESLTKLRFMFLNDNLLTGEVPGWILNSRNELDLSYNNFTGSAQPSCQQLPVNLVSSHVSTGKNK
ncbi:unnamed protein product [Dovyalis caffra]|uniref:Uncharacterized protein n=1 Tax=Dovyalis caffra TaxID=77055 RepID=A0AAV1SLJ1_9ROSI|nr:unnamed protein product [Dovyalis caffra]